MSEDRSYERMNEGSPVLEKATQGSLSHPDWDWLDRSIWTERMLAALMKQLRYKAVEQKTLSSP